MPLWLEESDHNDTEFDLVGSNPDFRLPLDGHYRLELAKIVEQVKDEHGIEVEHSDEHGFYWATEDGKDYSL